MAKVRISVDDGCVSDIRLSELCRKYDIELIIYLPAKWKEYAREKDFKPLTVTQAMGLSYKHEIGSHGITHQLLTRIPYGDAVYEIQFSKVLLQQRFGKFVKKFAPPRGYLTPGLTKVAQKYYQEIRLTKGEHLVHMHPNSGANSNKPWREAITDKTTELWGHSHELDRFNLWNELEEFLRGRTE